MLRLGAWCRSGLPNRRKNRISGAFGATAIASGKRQPLQLSAYVELRFAHGDHLGLELQDINLVNQLTVCSLDHDRAGRKCQQDHLVQLDGDLIEQGAGP